MREPAGSDLYAEELPELAIEAELPVLESAHPTVLAKWGYDSLAILAATGAHTVSGPVALLIELPQRIVHGEPSGVHYSVSLVKALLMRERFVDREHALADVCIRQGERSGIYVALKPFAV